MHGMRLSVIFLTICHVINQRPDEVWSYQMQRCLKLQIYHHSVSVSFRYFAKWLVKNAPKICGLSIGGHLFYMNFENFVVV